jgi:hypothetical protein
MADHISQSRSRESFLYDSFFYIEVVRASASEQPPLKNSKTGNKTRLAGNHPISHS